MAELPSNVDSWPDAEALASTANGPAATEDGFDHAGMDALDDEAEAAGPDIADHDDLVRRYLAEMGAFRRLTFEEEVALAKKIEAGRRARGRKPSTRKAPKRARTDGVSGEREAGWTAELDPAEARTHLIRANLRLVVSIAKQFSGRGLSLLDLIQEGNLGLMKAVDRFDWRRGCRFGTYATWWIRQSIGRAIGDQGRIIRLPAHMADSIGRVHRLRQSWMQLHEADPTAEELSQVARVPEERIRWIDQLTTPTVSIDWLLLDGERTVSDMLADESSIAPVDVLAERERDSLLHGSLRELTTRERQVLRMHFGIGLRRAYTLEEIGRKLQLTRERIRQIELKALKKLRHPRRRRLLEECVAATATPEKPSDGGEIPIDDGC